MKTETIYKGNCIEVMKDFPDGSIDCVVTSPPYWGLRDYGTDEQLGLEKTPEEFVANLVKVFSEAKRVLKSTGTCWINLGDSYARTPSKWRDDYKGSGKSGNTGLHKNTMGSTASWGRPLPKGIKPKELVGIPWRVAFALQADGWYLRQDIIWAKPNPMPESVQDRCTKAHEYIFLLTKSPKYFYDIDAIREKANYPNDDRGARGDRRRGTECNSMSGKTGETRNKRSVWTITTKPYKGAHFATFPIELPTYCIKAGCPEGGIVLDPFFGSGTTGLASQEQNRHWVGIELNEEYIEIAKTRTSQVNLFV